MTLELPHPDVLWTRARELQGSDDTADASSTAGENRLASEDSEGNWFALVRLGADRALIFGGDEESDLHETAYDPWGSVPDWAEAVDRTVDHPRIIDPVLTFVRWWDGQRWHRTPVDPVVTGEPADAFDGLELALRLVANPWFPGFEPALDRPEAVAAALGFEPPEPGMHYRKITTPATKGTDPVRIFVEIDDDYESRKVEHFRSGGLGFASGLVETDPTAVSYDAVESIEQIAQRPGFTVEQISPEEFQVEWIVATGWVTAAEED